MPETGSSSQVVSLSNQKSIPDPDEIAVRIYNVYKEKIMGILLKKIYRYAEDEPEKVCVNELEREITGYAKAKIGLHIKISPSYDGIISMLKKGYDVEDVDVNYVDAVDENLLTVYCDLPNGESFIINVYLRKLKDMGKEEYVKYSLIRNSILADIYRKMVRELQRKTVALQSKVESCVCN